MAKGFARVLIICVIALICQISYGRSLLAKQTHKVDWRAPHAIELNIALGDTVVISWGPGPQAGILQMAYPGICSGGIAASPLKKFTGMKASGTKSQDSKGKIKLTPTIGGSIFLTSSVKGECDAKWLRINVGAPVGR